eukprot:492491-Prorocentrum_minimum.AAC.3
MGVFSPCPIAKIRLKGRPMDSQHTNTTRQVILIFYLRFKLESLTRGGDAKSPGDPKRFL